MSAAAKPAPSCTRCHRRARIAIATMGCWPPTPPCARRSPRWRRYQFHHRLRQTPPARNRRRRSARPRAICGRCCSRASMQFYRGPARSVWPQCAPQEVPLGCASSPSSPSRVPCASFSITSANRAGRRGEQRSGLGPHPPAGAGGRIRSAHHLVKSNAAACWVRLGGRCSERGIFGLGRCQSGSCAQAHGNMRCFLRTGRRKLILTTTKRSRILGPGPLNCLSLSFKQHAYVLLNDGERPYPLGAEYIQVKQSRRVIDAAVATSRRSVRDML